MIDDGFRDGGQDDATGTNDVSSERTLTQQKALPHLLPPGVEGLEQVEIKRVSLSLLARALARDRVEYLRAVAEQARPLPAGRIVWNINSTAKGGGVAEMLQTLLAYGRGAGVDTERRAARGHRHPATGPRPQRPVPTRRRAPARHRAPHQCT